MPTLYREQYLDCLRVLTREANPAPFLKAMQYIHDWVSRFDYQNLDEVIAKMTTCNAFERSLVQFQLLMPGQAQPDPTRESNYAIPKDASARGVTRFRR